MSGATRAALAAAVLYFAVASFANRAVLADPFVLLPTPVDYIEREKPRFRLVYEADQKFVVGYIARLARAFALEPSRLPDVGLCAPLERAHTLGEHMFGQGLLGAIPYLVSRDPIFTFNAVSVLTTWISLLSMYALAFYWTRSFPAAFLTGLLFALHPNRLNNPAHIFVFGNAWTALALLAVHRLFDRERWFDAAVLALVLCLQLLESFYPVLGLAILGGTYGLVLCIQHRAKLPRLAPKLLAVAGVCGALAWLVLGPYLETQGSWEVLSGRTRVLLAPSKYLPGQPASPGWLLVVFAVVGLLDRLRGRRLAGDPRLPLLLAGFLVFWCTVHALRVPGLGRLPSPLLTLTPYIPGLDAVRAVAVLQFGVFLAASVLAAFGLLAVLERLATTGRAVVAALLAGAILVQTFHPPTARASFTHTPSLEGFASRPSDAELDLLQKLPDGAVLDVPLAFEPIMKLRMMPDYLLAAGYYEQPTAACYNSFLTGLQTEVQRFVAAVPAPEALEALSALGFRAIRVHHETLPDGGRALAAGLENDPRTQEIARADGTSVWALAKRPTTQQFDAIASATPPAAVAEIATARGSLAFRFVRAGEPTFRHPAPIEPTDVLLRWRRPGGPPLAESADRILLPPALAAGADAVIELAVDVPVGSGQYIVELVRPDAPETVLAARRVSVL